MIKYIIVIMLLVLAYTLFIYNLIDNVDKRMEIKEERLKNHIEFQFNRLRHEQMNALQQNEEDSKKLIKVMIDHKEVEGRVDTLKERGFEYPAILILYTKEILNRGDVIKVGGRYLEITGILFIGDSENKYTFDYIA